MTTNSVEQILELMNNGYTSCELSKHAMREVGGLVSAINHLANIILDIAGQDGVYGNQLNEANEWLDIVVPLLQDNITKEEWLNYMSGE